MGRVRVRMVSLVMATFVATGALAACGDDDGAGVVEIGSGSGSASGSASGSVHASGSGSASAPGSGSASAPGSGSASGSAHASGSGSGSAVASGCRVEGGTDAEGAAAHVTLDEWSIDVAEEVHAGAVTFEATNAGDHAHELVIVRGVAPDELPIVDGAVDESQLPDDALVGEIETFPAGETCAGTFELDAGTYSLYCNIVEEHDGTRESHVESGMVTALEVA